MKAEDILHAHELDILFDGRHKAYGAYLLRKQYGNRLTRAVFWVFGIFAILSAWALLRKPALVKKHFIYETATAHVLPDVLEEKKPEPKKPHVPKPETAKQNLRTQQFVSRVEVQPAGKTADKIRNLSDSIVIDSRTNDKGVFSPPLVQVPPTPFPPKPGAVLPGVPDMPDPSSPLEQAEQMPEFPGGTEALMRYLARNLQAPHDMGEGEMVQVKMRFVVGYDGKLRSFEPVMDPGEAFTSEVVRVLKRMPQWKPGKSRGRDVSVYYILPVTFAATP